MTEKIRNTIITVLFLAIVGTLCVANLVTPSQELSYAERRKLKQLPEFTFESVMDGSAFGDLDEYFTDQFVLRETFRTVKAVLNFNVLGRLDNNSIAIAEGYAMKLETTLREKAVLGAATKFNSLYESYFSTNQCYYALVPEKNYYLAEKNGYPTMDYDQLAQIVRENTRGEITEIGLYDALEASSYYTTDLHWRQETLQPVVDRLSDAMGFDGADLTTYEEQTLTGFYGAYYGQSSLPLQPDTLVYLTNAATQAASVYNLEKDATTGVYRPDLFDGMDPYDVYLSGATALLVIDNPLCETQRELIVLRDSFGSSLIPLLIESYSKITVIDIRYMHSSLIPDYVEITDQDLLFLYSTSVVNNSEILR